MKTSNDPRHQTRRLLVAVIYSAENSNDKDYSKITEDLVDTVRDSIEIDNYDKNMYSKILDGITNKHNELTTTIDEHSTDWELDKIYKADLAVLLIASWEIIHSDTPNKVIIDEAVELAKEFGDRESPKFINGVLAGIVKQYGD